MEVASSVLKLTLVVLLKVPVKTGASLQVSIPGRVCGPRQQDPPRLSGAPESKGGAGPAKSLLLAQPPPRSGAARQAEGRMIDGAAQLLGRCRGRVEVEPLSFLVKLVGFCLGNSLPQDYWPP